MIHKIILGILFILFGLKSSAQATLALVANSHDSAIRTACLVSDILIKQMGDKWYTTNILETTDLGIRSFSLKVDCMGKIIITAPRIKNKDIVVALENVASYIEKNHLVVYVSCGESSSIESKDKIKENIKRHLYNCSNAKYQFCCGWNLWPTSMVIEMSDNWYNKYYIENEKKAGRNPKSHIEWLKEKIDYYLSLPIKSSLDYGITNEDFCPQHQ